MSFEMVDKLQPCGACVEMVVVHRQYLLCLASRRALMIKASQFFTTSTGLLGNSDFFANCASSQQTHAIAQCATLNQTENMQMRSQHASKRPATRSLLLARYQN